MSFRAACFLAVASVIVMLSQCTKLPEESDLGRAESPQVKGDATVQGQETPTSEQGETRDDEAGVLRYLLPSYDGGSFPKSEAAKWGLAAPIEDGYSNPNAIAYDAAYMDEYANWALNAKTICGVGSYEIVTDDGVRKLDSGLGYRYLGFRFRAEDLLQFLQRRVDGPSHEQSFKIQHPEALKAMAQRTDLTQRRLAWSPWERDISTALRLLVEIEHKPVYPLAKALLHDPSNSIRREALISLGQLASVIPSAVEDIVPFIDDEELSSTAAAALALAGSVGVPEIIKTFDHEDSRIHNQAVFSLARMEDEGASIGLHAALNHRSAEIRNWALSVMHSRVSGGDPACTDRIIDDVANRLIDGNDEIRWRAVLVLSNLGSSAARAQPALFRAANEDASYDVRKIAEETLRTIKGDNAPAR